MTIFNVRYTSNGINVYNYDYNYDHMFIFYTKKEFDLIKEVINDRLKMDDIGPAVRLVSLYNRHGLINNIVTKRLYNCIRNEIYITCSMYDEFKEMEKKENG